MRTSPARRSGLKYLAGLAVILGAVGWMLTSGLSQNLTFFLTPSEYRADEARYAGRTIRLGGIVERGSVRYDRDSLELSFQLSDGVAAVPARYKGAVPQLFREGQGVTVEGRLENGVFVGQELLVKHSEEYKAPKPGERPLTNTLVEDPR